MNQVSISYIFNFEIVLYTCRSISVSPKRVGAIYQIIGNTVDVFVYHTSTTPSVPRCYLLKHKMKYRIIVSLLFPRMDEIISFKIYTVSIYNREFIFIPIVV